jgi:thioredoxin reductase (NADPH)
MIRTQVAIVGAGPIGLELAINLRAAGIDYLQFDAGQVGHTISWYPRQTRFFSSPDRIAIAGVPLQTADQSKATREEYLAYLRAVVQQFDLPVRTYERVVALERSADGFEVRTQRQGQTLTYVAEKVVVSIGDMHRPRKLNVPGEDLPHVSHYFTDPHPYFRQRLLVVGGRNSAAEAALRCWRAGARVSLSYRRAELDPKVIKHWILPDLLAQFEAGKIGFLPGTLVSAIRPGEVELARCQPGTIDPSDERLLVPADFVLLLTGFEADQSLFETAGVRLEGPQRAPAFNPETMETNVPGLYVAGTAAAGTQKKYTLFIENSHEHVGKIVQALTGCWPSRLGTIPPRRYDLPFEEIEAN